MHHKLDILVTNFVRIFHYNRNITDLVMRIFHYKGNNLIFHSIYKGITFIFMFNLLNYLYTRTKYVHFLI